MSVWLTPELKPFVGATYFPPEDQVGGRPGFRTILNHISKQVWKFIYLTLPNWNMIQTENRNQKKLLGWETTNLTDILLN